MPVERQGRPTTVPRWIVIVEGVPLEALESVRNVDLRSLAQHGCAGPVERDTYRLQIMVTK